MQNLRLMQVSLPRIYFARPRRHFGRKSEKDSLRATPGNLMDIQYFMPQKVWRRNCDFTS